MSIRSHRTSARSLRARSRAGSDARLESLEPRCLLAADPITPDHPLWIALPGTAVVDGVLSDPDWSDAFEIVRSTPFDPYNSMSLKFMYDASGLYLGLDVLDPNLWADGKAAPGTEVSITERYLIETDDSITFYFDPNNSRDEYFQSTDYAFGTNLGSQAEFESHAGALFRISPITSAIALAKYVTGDGAGGAPDVNPGGTLPAGLKWVTVMHGTFNNNADTDIGWTTEFFFPWASIGLSGAPANGGTIGMNFDLIFDRLGGPRDFTDNRTANGGADRWDKPPFVDDHLQGAQSSYDASRAGLRGPVNYAVLMFVNPAAGSAPDAISGATATNVTGYSAELAFDAPAGVGSSGLGHVVGYDIRLASSAITSEAAWFTATEFDNIYVPRLAGLAESLRVIDLTPSTTYHVVVRARDAAGNLGPLSNDITFTTQTTVQDPSDGLRLVPSPNGRSLVTEAGGSFIAVGDHLGLPWAYTRNLYTGNVWNSSNNSLINFSTNPGSEGVAGPYFDALAASGVTVMRVYLELQNVYKPPFGLPEGTLWLEWQNGQFNANMRQFMLNVLQEASRVGMYVIFAPFDTFSYDETFLTEFPWSTNNGGPLTDINNFFQETTFPVAGVPDSGTLGLAERRMKQVVDWVNTPEFAPYANRLLGWEPVSEWDSYEWTLNAEGNAEPGRETEFRRRAQWIDDLASYIQSYDPLRLVLNSTIAQDPRGPEARQVFYSRAFDMLTPHLYTSPNAEPMNNIDFDRSIRPAEWNAALTNYWLTNITNRRPVLNAEWGIDRTRFPTGTPDYGPDFTQAEDEALYRTMIWSGVASGQVGTSLRIATDELAFRGYILTDAMQASQATMSRFFADTGVAIDTSDFNFDPLLSRARATSAAGKYLHAWGTSDGLQGVVYVLHDTNRTAGTVTDGKLTVAGLRADSIFDVEAWSTAGGTTAPLATFTGAFVGDGTLTIDLPDFAQDVAVKFKARSSAGSTERIVAITHGTSLITFFLDVGGQPVARIQDESGTVTLQDISGLSHFVGEVVDMTPFIAFGGVNLAVTDAEHHLWLISGDPATATWQSVDLTSLIGGPGLTGDLTTYIASWGTVHISGLDARGHSINYFYQPGVSTQWLTADLTEQISGPALAGGLTAFVTSWGALNVVGLNAQGEVIAFWWSLSSNGWQIINFTTTFNGPTITDQLDAYFTPWNALNIVGRTGAGHIVAYWWAPALGLSSPWRVSDLSEAAEETNPLPMARGTKLVISPDGRLSLFAIDASNHLQQLTWSPAVPFWKRIDVTAEAAAAPTIEFPIGGTAATTRITVAGRNAAGSRALVVYTYLLDSGLWQALDTGIPIET